MSNKNPNRSLLDLHQIQNLMFDTDNDAQRVVIVGGMTEGQIMSVQQPAQVQTQVITVPQIERVEVPVIVKELEIKEIQVPFIQQETKIVEIEKVIFVPEIKIVEVEKPVVITQVQYKELEPKVEGFKRIIFGILAIQVLSILTQIVFHFFK